ncbi:MAG: isochorismatase family protein, partial [Thermoplasmata archaeon]
LILHKGIHPDVDSYSAFQDNDKRHKTGLEGYLKEIGVKKVFVCGLATDYCVKFTAIDASDAGFVTAVIIDACRGVDKKTTDAALEEMKVKGISILSSKELLIYG